jgi:hypothetical protein
MRRIQHDVFEVKLVKPLAAFNPPPETEQTIRIFEAVNKALNDIDRSMYGPIATLRERRGELIAQYEAVGKRFEKEAAMAGLAGWLRYAVLQRTFVLSFDAESLDNVRRLFDEMERLGHPDVNPLISVRAIWANRLAQDGELEEAQMIGRRLLADVEEFRERYPNVFVDTDDDLGQFRQRHGI